MDEPGRIRAEDYAGCKTARRRLPALAEQLVKLLTARGETVAGAESCTAGLVADCIACVPGASRVLWGSFVCYTPDAKAVMLGVCRELIDGHGAVSRPVALAMAEGALEKSGASWAFSVTGLAGPDGDGSPTPVGTVWAGIAGREGEPGLPPAGGPSRSEAKDFLFSGSRNAIREAAAAVVLEELLKRLS